MCSENRSADGSVDLIPDFREQSHCHRAAQPCLLGLLCIFLIHAHILTHCEHMLTPQHTCGSGRAIEWSCFLFLGSGTRLWLPGLQGGRASWWPRKQAPFPCHWPTVFSFKELVCALLHPFNSEFQQSMSPTFVIFHPTQAFCRGKQASNVAALQCRLFILLFGTSAVSFPPVIAQ